MLRDTWIVFRRYFGRTLTSPLYMGVSLAQPVLYLVLFAPLLKSVASVPGFPGGGAPSWLQAVADVNPVLYAVEAQRTLFANHLADASVFRGFLAVGVLALAAAWASARSFGRAVA